MSSNNNFEFKNEYEIIKYLKNEFNITGKHAEEVIKDITEIENNEPVDYIPFTICSMCSNSIRLKECERCHDLVCSKDRTYCKDCNNLLCNDCAEHCPFCYVECCDLKGGNHCSNFCEKYKSFNGIDRVNICWNCKSHFCEEHMIICQHCKAQHCGRCIHEGNGCAC
jgi:hypothetical protein